MFRINRALVALAVAALLCLGGSSAVAARDQQAQQPPSTPGKWIPPVKGQAEVQYLAPVTKVDAKTNTVTTTFQVKNVSNGPIAGLTLEQFWWDRKNNPVRGGDRQRVKKLLQPGDVVEIVLTTEKDSSMFRDTYQFSHANGTIKATKVKVF
jgi:hypothetical protein